MGERGSLVRVVGVAVLATFLSACSESESGDSAQAGSGGGAGSGATGTGGSAATAGGGSAGAPCLTGTQLGPSDVDLTLGGLNADLPAASMDCLTVARETSMCAALSAIVNGVPREILCTDPSNSSIDGRSLSCNAAAGENIAITSSGLAGAPPTTFTVTWTSPMMGGPISLQLTEGSFSTNSTSLIEARAAGWVNKFESTIGCNDVFYGVVAASWSDTGMGETRVRGTYQSRTF